MNADESLEMLRRMANAAAFHDGVLRAFVTILASGKPLTFENVWLAARFTLPPDAPDDIQSEIRSSIRAIFDTAAALSKSSL